MSDYHYIRENRLLTPNDFKSVFNSVELKSGSDFCLLLAKPTKIKTPRIGFIVSKKNAKLAVSRNRIKRAVREYFRLNKEQFLYLDIVFLARKKLSQQTKQKQNLIIAKSFERLKFKNQKLLNARNQP